MQRSCLPLLQQWMPRCGRRMRLFAAGMELAASPHQCSCDPHHAPAQSVGRKNPGEFFLPTNSPGHALHCLVLGIQHAGHLPSGGEGGTAMRETNERGLWARQLRSRRSQSLSGPCASGARSSPAAGVRATMTDRTLMAVQPSPHGGPGPVVASGGSVGKGYACVVCKSVAFRLRRGCNTSVIE